MTRRRWIASEWDAGSALLMGDQANHLIRVLRAHTGMECDVVTAEGVWRGSIASIGDGLVRFDLLFPLEAEPALPVTLLLAIFKFDRMEWMFEKATELGVARLIPMVARRSEKHLVQAAPARVERWRRIVHEAAKQCRRSDVPVVEDALAMQAALKQRAETPGLNLLLAERERTTTLYAALESLKEQAVPVHIAIGPEGGWTTEEENLFVGNLWQPVTLGPRILRAETAGITAMALAAALLG